MVILLLVEIFRVADASGGVGAWDRDAVSELVLKVVKEVATCFDEVSLVELSSVSTLLSQALP